MAASSKSDTGNFKVSGSILARTAAVMLPFYKKVAASKSFAIRWSRALEKGDLDTLIAMFKATTPPAALSSFGTNGIGYFIDFEYPAPVLQYSNGLTIPPGLTQFTFSHAIHQDIARSIIPYYSALKTSPAYASALANAINSNDLVQAKRLVRRKVTTSALKSIAIRFSGIGLDFKYKSSKFIYRSSLFREIVG